MEAIKYILGFLTFLASVIVSIALGCFIVFGTIWLSQTLNCPWLALTLLLIPIGYVYEVLRHL